MSPRDAVTVRADTCAGLAFAGVQLDEGRNAEPAGDMQLSASGSPVAVLRIHAREDWMMALAARS